ncbi:hypothetical protein DWG18_06945 [Lysobacter sp. TY2-98]|uniref:hypothetical protein n=1 Tax=Lysobacter sp. TY2-98 TaxID=2290922 RepID=UPI000E20A776|nr:hypothetical protein [Lysobacter sp. TY2-98]AXK72043.1 hypothetical protein DWG18_06945 [Lysobacter sp. TY2-98]
MISTRDVAGIAAVGDAADRAPGVEASCFWQATSNTQATADAASQGARREIIEEGVMQRRIERGVDAKLMGRV